jgi:hypothetical protein
MVREWEIWMTVSALCATTVAWRLGICSAGCLTAVLGGWLERLARGPSCCRCRTMDGREAMVVCGLATCVGLALVYLLSCLLWLWHVMRGWQDYHEAGEARRRGGGCSASLLCCGSPIDVGDYSVVPDSEGEESDDYHTDYWDGASGKDADSSAPDVAYSDPLSDAA